MLCKLVKCCYFDFCAPFAVVAIKKINQKIYYSFFICFYPLLCFLVFSLLQFRKTIFAFSWFSFSFRSYIFAIILIINLISFGFKLPKWFYDKQHEELSYNLFSDVLFLKKLLVLRSCFYLLQ